MKTRERRLAERLRRERGMSVREIAKDVGVARSTASLWVRGIELTNEQRRALAARNPIYNGQCKGAATNKERARALRLAYQAEGRRRVHPRDPLYLAGCMLFWGEGSKSRNTVEFANSDPAMVELFVRFLRVCFEIPDRAIRVRCHLYADHDGRRGEIEQFWLDLLGLPRGCLNRSVTAISRASQGKRRRTLPYGTCRVPVSRVQVAQTIYGSIQEFGGFERPEWLG